MDAISYRDLTVWQKAMDLVEMVYRLTRGFPRVELYGLTSQLRRATISVPANIAEGNTRSTRKEYANFLSIARSSANEVETLLVISQRLGYTRAKDIQPIISMVDEVSRMLNTLRARLVA